MFLCPCFAPKAGYDTLLASDNCTAVVDYGVAQEQNVQHRPRQEDAYQAIDGFGDDTKQAFFAVFDGDGGDECANFAAKNLHDYLLDELETLDEESLHPKEISSAVKEKISKAFLRTDASMDADGLGQLPNSGCTAVVCLVREEHGKRFVYTGNVGDCRAVLSHGGKAFRLSQDHKASDQEEALRIEAAGGVVFDKCVMGVLTVSRALGHQPLKALVTGSPSVSRTSLKKTTDDLLILACDGVWEVMEDQEAVDFVKAKISGGASLGEVSRALVVECIRRYSADNITAVVIQL